MAKLPITQTIEVTAVESHNLDTVCLRGSAPLAHLAAISQADLFDQVVNPNGLQRDLSPKHASDAHEYAIRSSDDDYPRAFPEVVLNIRDKKIVDIEEIDAGANAGFKAFNLTFTMDKMHPGQVHVSRVDGNHRLFYAEGDDRREPIMLNAPFQLHVGLSQEQERSLFVDFNSNQKGLNSSHLSIMQSKLTAEEQEIKDHLDRWIAKRLAEDPDSPWCGLIHLGGSKQGTRAQGLTRIVNFASLQIGVQKTLTKSQYIHDLTDPTAQYMVIRNYWQAVKRVFSEEWAHTKEYLLLKNIGVTSLSILGGTIIDRCMPKGMVGVQDMERYLLQARSSFDWGHEASGDRNVVGMSGNQAATIIAAAMAEELSDETGSNLMRELQSQLLEAAKPS